MVRAFIGAVRLCVAGQPRLSMNPAGFTQEFTQGFTGESTTTIYSRFSSLVRYDSTLLVYRDSLLVVGKTARHAVLSLTACPRVVFILLIIGTLSGTCLESGPTSFSSIFILYVYNNRTHCLGIL